MKIHAKIVIVGAGIVGSSAAYWLAKYGEKDVLVIDKGELFENDGSSSHAPGGVNPLSNNPSMAKLAGDTIDLFETLPLWKPGRKPLYMVGGVDVARTDERMNEVKRLYTNGKGFGVEVHQIGPKEISELFPLMDGSKFKGGLYTPRKPVVAGPHVCGSLAVEAEKMGGTRFVANTKATEFVIENNRIVGIKTNNPDMEYITCEQALICTNIWTPALSETFNVVTPLMPAEHQYLKSAPLPELAHVSDRTNADHEIIYPSVRDMDGGTYYRHWWDSLGIGNYHHRPLMIDSRKLGKSADHAFTPEDFVEARKIVEDSIPAARGVDYPYSINGMFSFSVDGLPILGPTGVDGVWMATACWVTNSGGVGKAMAEWMITGEPEVDMRTLNVNRFLPHQLSDKYIQISCAKAYAEVHDVIHPAQSTSKPRNIRHTPFYPRHLELDAELTPSAGLEIPYWYNSNAKLLEKYGAQVPDRSGWPAQHWSRIQGAEHLAMRDTAGLMDLTALSIIEISGADAAAYMDYVCTSRLSRVKVGGVTYTLMCTPKGGIKRDIAISRIAEDTYWLFTGNGTVPQELDWMRRLVGDYDVVVNDLTSQYAALGLFGPNARAILEQVTPNDISDAGFPFYTWQTIEIGMHKVYAMRISYVGELGWELHMSMDTALAVRDEIWAAGAAHDLVPVGVGAMRSMRVEKGYRVWGGDIHTEHNPYDAGMGWMVKLKKDNFVGKAALAKIKAQPRTRQLVTITVDHPNCVPTGNEPIMIGDEVIGQITSGAWAYSVGKYVGFGYVPVEHAVPGTKVSVGYLAEEFAGEITADVLFDPNNERMKA